MKYLSCKSAICHNVNVPISAYFMVHLLLILTNILGNKICLKLIFSNENTANNLCGSLHQNSPLSFQIYSHYMVSSRQICVWLICLHQLCLILSMLELQQCSSMLIIQTSFNKLKHLYVFSVQTARVLELACIAQVRYSSIMPEFVV